MFDIVIFSGISFDLWQRWFFFRINMKIYFFWYSELRKSDGKARNRSQICCTPSSERSRIYRLLWSRFVLQHWTTTIMEYWTPQISSNITTTQFNPILPLTTTICQNVTQLSPTTSLFRSSTSRTTSCRSAVRIDPPVSWFYINLFATVTLVLICFKRFHSKSSYW